MSAIQGFNFDRERLDILLKYLKYFEQGQMTVEQAQELKTMLEELYTRALDDGDINTARSISSILITLKGFLSGRISFSAKSFSAKSFTAG